jgi:hypothetical protein
VEAGRTKTEDKWRPKRKEVKIDVAEERKLEAVKESKAEAGEDSEPWSSLSLVCSSKRSI